METLTASDYRRELETLVGQHPKAAELTVPRAWLVAVLTDDLSGLSDEAWMRRVYPEAAYVPSEMSYETFCRIARGRWEADHLRLKRRLDALVVAAERVLALEGWSDHGWRLSPHRNQLRQATRQAREAVNAT
jgi:hypothetical protein